MRHNSTPGGKIVLMGSIAGVAPDPTFPEYSSTKAAVINFARAVARPLRIKENISVNVVCPNAVPTKLDPPEFHAAVGTDALTSTETVVSAFLEFLEEQGDSRRYACALECSQDRLIVLKEPEVGNGEISLRSVTPWDGYFKMIHGEPSELDGALPESTV
ncbi:putative 15-hydroxyprostaglandin dehydrogenase protein [Ilyonectria robusta]